MADKWPLANGVWSNAANWNDGTLPLAGDDVYADNRTVTIDQDVTVASVRTTQRSGGTAGGGFALSANYNITANVIAGTGVGLSINTGATNVTVTGNVFGGSTSQIDGIRVVATNATVNVIGDIYATVGASAYGLRLFSGSGVNTVVNIVGDAYGDAGSNVAAVNNSDTGTINITGNVYGGNGSNGSFGADCVTAGTINITGNCEAKQSVAVRNNATGTININGTVIGSQNGWSTAGAANNSNGTIRITRAKGNGFGNGSVGLFSAFAVTNSQTGTVEVEEIEFGDLGNSPTSGPISFKNITGNKCIVYRPSLAKKTLVDPSTVGDYPANANVRLGTQFNFGNNTGTLAVPNPNQVAVGVATDNTVGTAVITEASLLPVLQQALSPNSPIAVERSIDDNKAITFSWPVSGATITGQKSIDNGAYSAVAGAVNFLRSESGRHYYTLAYNASDRSNEESTIRYKMTDGTYTKYFNLRLVPPVDNAAIADAVLTESVLDHRNVNNSLAKFIWQIRNANLTVDGTVTSAITPTTLTFSSNVVATTSAYAHAVLLFITGPLAGENSPIISYNNTNGVFVLEEPLTAAPSDGDEFVVLAGSHVHAIADIQSGLASSLQAIEILDAISNIEVDNQAIAEAVEIQLADDFASVEDAINNVQVDISEGDISTIASSVFQLIVGSGVARYSLPATSDSVEGVRYADFDLDINTPATAADSRLVLSIGCEGHTTPYLEADSVTGLLSLLKASTIDANWASVDRISSTLVRVNLNVNAMKNIPSGEYLIELKEITSADAVKLRFEKPFFVRSGAGRIIE